MKYIGKSKITRLRPKKNIEYPLLRLPQSHAHLAGDTAHIFEIDNNGKPLFVISLDEDFDGNIKVIQQNTNSDTENRLNYLESRIKSLEKSLEKSLTESQKQSSSTRKPKE
ncbi:hypothetical protein [Methanococcoides seepicolus]|uniref:Uncharacterized protein n=1 Tax=Methanococcoides seepicolus TaxID=2828780 RepID=A0A9E5DAT5_9EURY|nr:hypothetical protein [Methanococcoides seepicolus]MCM1986995.1 hypothetical protein [Methanococcoides seepicolus]